MADSDLNGNMRWFTKGCAVLGFPCIKKIKTQSKVMTVYSKWVVGVFEAPIYIGGPRKPQDAPRKPKEAPGSPREPQDAPGGP